MSLSIDGFWKAGVWGETVWADDVWREGEYTSVEIHPPTAIRYIVASNQSLTISKKRNNIVIPSKN